MTREALQSLASRVIGKKGIMRSSAWWVNKLFNEVLNYCDKVAKKAADDVKVKIDTDLSTESENPVGSKYLKAYIDNKASIPIETRTSGGRQSLPPNTFVIFNNPVSSLNVWEMSGDSGVLLNYIFEFTASSQGCEFSYPVGWKWANGSIPEIEANTTYQVSVVHNCAVITSFYK